MDRAAWSGYSPWGCKELDTTKLSNTSLEVMSNKESPDESSLQNEVKAGPQRSKTPSKP